MNSTDRKYHPGRRNGIEEPIREPDVLRLGGAGRYVATVMRKYQHVGGETAVDFQQMIEPHLVEITCQKNASLPIHFDSDHGADGVGRDSASIGIHASWTECRQRAPRGQHFGHGVPAELESTTFDKLDLESHVPGPIDVVEFEHERLPRAGRLRCIAVQPNGIDPDAGLCQQRHQPLEMIGIRVGNEHGSNVGNPSFLQELQKGCARSCVDHDCR